MKFGKRVMGVFAHPDDETFGCGGFFALAKKKRSKVYWISATRGEKGKQHLAIPMSSDRLMRVRVGELRAAGKELGVDRIEAWRYPDGTLDQQNQEEVVKKIMRRIMEWKPDVVVTFGPDGATRHRDHVAIHCFTHHACERARVAGHAVKYIYWRVFPSQARRALKSLLPSRRKTAGHYHDRMARRPCKDKDVLNLNVASVLEIKNRAAAYHKSQNYKWFLDLPKKARKVFWEREYYYCAYDKDGRDILKPRT